MQILSLLPPPPKTFFPDDDDDDGDDEGEDAVLEATEIVEAALSNESNSGR